MMCSRLFETPILTRGHRGRDRMVVGLQLPVQSVPITSNCEFVSRSLRVVFDTTLSDKVS
jgi:hypothetical protein